VTTVFFLRHAESTANRNGILAGRIPDISLSERGFKESRKLVKTLSDLEFDLIISSPLQRCVETLTPFLKRSGKSLTLEPGFQEMDYGTWSGKELKKLSKKSEWKSVQSNPQKFRFPKGESFKEASRRVSAALERIEEQNPKKRILVATHGDIIKLAVTLTLGLPINKFQKLIVDPASISTVDLEHKKVIALNQKARKQWSFDLSVRSLIGGGTDR
jgi:broad specificity phosphatase PhoE